MMHTASFSNSLPCSPLPFLSRPSSFSCSRSPLIKILIFSPSGPASDRTCVVASLPCLS